MNGVVGEGCVGLLSWCECGFRRGVSGVVDVG